MKDLAHYLPALVEIARRAGEEILKIYDSDFEVVKKSDGSPLTLADKNANALIEKELLELDSEIPIVSEESDRPPYNVHRDWQQYWLVDPLDGTKEFTKRNGEFTVNIALIEKGTPVMGVVHVPVTNVTYYASVKTGAFKQEQDQNAKPIRVKNYQNGKAIVVASRSHANPVLKDFYAQLDSYETLSMGSSLKLCLVAEGEADIYPRLGLTSEWDTAAAHCIVNVAGGRITDLDGNDLTYNKEDILNPWFVVSGAGDYPWLEKLNHARDQSHT